MSPGVQTTLGSSEERLVSGDLHLPSSHKSDQRTDPMLRGIRRGLRRLLRRVSLDFHAALIVTLLILIVLVLAIAWRRLVVRKASRKEMDVRASTFSHHFELRGSDLAIQDFFDCQRVVALHVQ